MNFFKKHCVFILPFIWGLPWVTIFTPVIILIPDNRLRAGIAGFTIIVKAGALGLQALLWLRR